jgi:hypothetical protein
MFKEYISQISKDSGRSSLTSDTLHSPGIDGKSVELFSVEEESSGLRHSNNSNHKTSSVILVKTYLNYDCIYFVCLGMRLGLVLQ